MKWLLIAGGTLVGVVLLALGASFALVESEEVVVIRTYDANGESHSTRVWIVDHDGAQWIAPGNRSNGWFQRLLGDPRLELARDDVPSCRVAHVVESPDSIPVLESFLEKYASVIRATGILNRLIEPEGDPTPPVAVRLDDC